MMGLLESHSFPSGSDGKESVYNAVDLDSIPGSGRSPEKETATHSILAWENPVDRGAWWATVHDATKELDMT